MQTTVQGRGCTVASSHLCRRTHDRTIEEARTMAAKAIECYLESLQKGSPAAPGE